MNVEEFLKRHPKPWKPSAKTAGCCGQWDYSFLKDGLGKEIELDDLIEYISDLEIALDKGRPGKPAEVPFGEFPTMNAMSPCGTTCNTKKITFDMYNKAKCHRCGRDRPFYDRKV